MVVLYLIGSLRNPKIPSVAEHLRNAGFEVYDDWYAPGPKTDDYWKGYEKKRGRSYAEALEGYHARQVFELDRYHLSRAHGAVLLLPAGKSGYIEFGYTIGQKKPGFVLLDADSAPRRYDIMTRFGATICAGLDDLAKQLTAYHWPPTAQLLPISPLDGLWLAGILEGGGSFTCDSMNGRPQPRIALQMADEDSVRRVAALLGGSVWGVLGRSVGGADKKPSPRRGVWACEVIGLLAAEWMRVLRGYMSTRRQEQIDKVLMEWNPSSYPKWRPKKLGRVKGAGER